MNDIYLKFKLINKGKNKVKNIYRQKKILNKFISCCENCFVYFATFTFKNDNVNYNSFTKYLRRHNIKYKLIFDYGKINEREHLHGIIKSDLQLNKNDLNFYGWTYLIQLKTASCKLYNYIIKYSCKFLEKNKKMLASR